jgi:hypothetical protein
MLSICFSVYISEGSGRKRTCSRASELKLHDWKSPLADKGQEIIKWYLPEVQKLAAGR